MKVILFTLLISLALAVNSFAQGPALSLTWQDNSDNETTFNVERADSTAGPFANIGSVAANVTTYTDVNLPQAVERCYRINAANEAGVSAYSDTACAVTKASLAVTKSGDGTGVVTGAGINCGLTCAVWVDGRSQVTLTAAPAAGSGFIGWTGDCTGSGLSCVVTMNAAKTVIATFKRIPEPPSNLGITAGVQ